MNVPASHGGGSPIGARANGSTANGHLFNAGPPNSGVSALENIFRESKVLGSIKLHKIQSAFRALKKKIQDAISSQQSHDGSHYPGSPFGIGEGDEFEQIIWPAYISVEENDEAHPQSDELTSNESNDSNESPEQQSHIETLYPPAIPANPEHPCIIPETVYGIPPSHEVDHGIPPLHGYGIPTSPPIGAQPPGYSKRSKSSARFPCKRASKHRINKHQIQA